MNKNILSSWHLFFMMSNDFTIYIINMPSQLLIPILCNALITLQFWLIVKLSRCSMKASIRSLTTPCFYSSVKSNYD